MKSKTTNQLAEIGKSSETIGRLKAELAERNATLAALQDKERAVGTELHTTAAELAATPRSLEETEQKLADRKRNSPGSWPSSTCIRSWPKPRAVMRPRSEPQGRQARGRGRARARTRGMRPAAGLYQIDEEAGRDHLGIGAHGQCGAARAHQRRRLRGRAGRGRA